MKTRITELFGIEHPIIQGGMHYVGFAELAAAVSNAGGLGIITGLTQRTPDALASEIARCRTMTDRPFGVNVTFLPAVTPPDYDGYIRAIIDGGVTIVETAGNNPQKWLPAMKAAGIRIIHKCTSVRHSLKAQSIGCDAVSVDGFECGGHPGEDDIPNFILLPRAAEELTIPFVASGGMADGRSLVAALALGADGINMGTRFIATREAPVHERVKQALVAASELDTRLVMRPLRNTERVLKNAAVDRVLEKERALGSALTFADIATEVSGVYPRILQQGELDAGVWSCGMVAGLIHDIPTVRELIDRIMVQADDIIRRLQNPLWLCLLTLGVLCSGAVAASAQPYSAQQRGEVVQLEDARSQTIVSILPGVGDIAFSMKVKGHDILRWPYGSVEQFTARPALSGIPFVGPWANRLDEQAFYANGKKYPFDMELGNVRGAIPIHGFLSTTDRWHVIEMKADGDAAWITSRLEFFREPAWMKQWPFAHTIELTYRLERGALEVRTAITNMSAEAMPVAIGFHPYFQLTDSPRSAWTVSIAARTHWLLAPTHVPTGDTESADSLLVNRRSVALDDFNLDDVFSDLERDAEGRATMSVAGKAQRLDVVLGPGFRSVVIWAPHPENRGRGSQSLGATGTPGRANASQTTQDRNFICIEPMAGVTDALNLAHRGRYSELQSIAPGGVWRASFWVTPSGF